MTSLTATPGELSVPGAVLHHQVRGSGPLLLISQSGDGDADRSNDLAGHLASRYTVVTYDRRGLARSAPDDPARGVTMEQHADDVHRLLGALTDRPALMLGCSLGAVIGLHVAVRHPGRLAALIAHEPVAPRLLPAPDRARHERELAGIQALYRRDGLAATFREVAKVLGIDPVGQDVEPEVTPRPMTPQRIADFGFFVEHDFTAIIRDTLDVAALRTTATRIVPAVGRTSPPTIFDRRCAGELAALLGTAFEEFPGGHNGNTTHPRGYAARVCEVLGAASRPSPASAL